MQSPSSNHTISPFTSLRTSHAHTSPYTHSRNNSTNKSISNLSQPAEPMRVPSHKKLTLTYQNTHIRSNKQSQKSQLQGKSRLTTQLEPINRPISIQCMSNEQDGAMAWQQSLMIHFQQKVENLKHQYFYSLRDYEARIDELQQQLHRNTIDLQHKNSQITELETALRELKQQQRHKEQKGESQLKLKIDDLQIRLSVMANHAQNANAETQQIAQRLTTKVIKCFGSRLAVLRQMQTGFIRMALNKMASLEERVEAREKQEQSVGTRGSMQSVEEPHFRSEEHGVSFWDDCFFYPSERSQNCNLIAEMWSRRSEPLNCWIDHEGYLRYCDSGSFFFNRKGEKILLIANELQWLQQQGMLRIY